MHDLVCCCPCDIAAVFNDTRLCQGLVSLLGLKALVEALLAALPITQGIASVRLDYVLNIALLLIFLNFTLAFSFKHRRFVTFF